MKQMIYKDKVELEILDSGIINNRKYFIINNGPWPCAYVQLHEDETRDRNYYENHINVHDGITFCGKSVKFEDDDTYIGWDYAHFEDYTGFDSLKIDISIKNKYTTEEMLEDVKQVIKQLEEMRDETNI